MSNLTYVRWRKGEPRPGRVFDPLTAEHPAYRSSCVECNSVLGNGESVQLVAVMVSDSDDWESFETGAWVTASAALMHEACVSDLSSDALEQLIVELVRV